MTDKQTYEQQISQSPVFSLEKGTAAYASAAFKLKELLFSYLTSKQDKKGKSEDEWYESYGLEIFEVATACIESYDPEQGTPFLHYFNHSWKIKYYSLRSESKISQTYGGLHFTGSQKNILFLYDKVCKMAVKEQLETSSEKFLHFLAENTGWSKEQCIEAIKMAHCRSMSETQSSGEDEIVSLFDTIPAAETATSSVDQQAGVSSIFAQMDDVFRHLQQRQTVLASSLFTMIVLKEVGDYIISKDIPLDQYSFCNHVILERYIKTGVLPMQKELAIDLGVAESQISRTLNSLLAKLQSALTTLD